MNKTAQALFAVWLVVAAFVGYLISGLLASRHSAEQHLHDQALSFVRLVAQHASAAFDRADLSLLGVMDHLRPTDLMGAGRLTDGRRKEIEGLLISQQQRTAGIVEIPRTIIRCIAGS